MSSSKQSSHTQGLISLCPWKWLIGVACLAGLYVFVDTHADWHSIFDPWRNVSSSAIAISLLLFIASHLVRAYRIFLLLFERGGGAYLGVAKISALHQLANNILPMRLGELVLPTLMRRYYAMSWQHGFARLIWLRFADVLFMGALIGVLVLVQLPLVYVLVWSSLALTVAILSAVGFGRFFKKLPRGRWYQALIDTAPASPLVWCRLMASTVVAWSCKLLGLSLLLKALISIDYVRALSATIGGEFSSILPIHGVLGAGSFEAAFLLGAGFWQQPSAQLISAAVNIHVFILMSTTLVAAVLSPIKIALSKPAASTELQGL